MNFIKRPYNIVKTCEFRSFEFDTGGKSTFLNKIFLNARKCFLFIFEQKNYIVRCKAEFFFPRNCTNSKAYSD